MCLLVVQSDALTRVLPLSIPNSQESQLPRFRNWSVGRWELSDYVDSHRTGGTAHRLDCGLEILAVQIGKLGLGDVLNLFRGDRADLVAVRLTRAFSEV